MNIGLIQSMSESAQNAVLNSKQSKVIVFSVVLNVKNLQKKKQKSQPMIPNKTKTLKYNPKQHYIMSEKTSTYYPLARTIKLAKASGAERIGKEAALALDSKVGAYVDYLTRKATVLANHAGRKTINSSDIEIAASE